MLAVLVEPLGEIVGFDPHVVAQDLRRRCRWCETDYRARTVLQFPGGPQSRHCRRFARARGTHQKIQGAARGRDLLHAKGLVE